MNDVQMRNGATLAGASLIVLGVIFLLITQGALDLNMGTLWPVILVLVGVVMLGWAFVQSNSAVRSAQIVVGIIPLLLGLFFLTFTLGIFPWGAIEHSMAYIPAHCRCGLYGRVPGRRESAGLFDHGCCFDHFRGVISHVLAGWRVVLRVWQAVAHFPGDSGCDPAGGADASQPQGLGVATA